MEGFTYTISLGNPNYLPIYPKNKLLPLSERSDQSPPLQKGGFRGIGNTQRESPLY